MAAFATLNSQSSHEVILCCFLIQSCEVVQGCAVWLQGPKFRSWEDWCTNNMGQLPSVLYAGSNFITFQKKIQWWSSLFLPLYIAEWMFWLVVYDNTRGPSLWWEAIQPWERVQGPGLQYCSLPGCKGSRPSLKDTSQLPGPQYLKSRQLLIFP